MNAEIKLKKQDHGMYDDTFHLEIEVKGLGKKEIKISESDFYAISSFFLMRHEIHPFPNNPRETAY